MMTLRKRGVLGWLLLFSCAIHVALGTHWVGVSDRKNWWDAKRACESGVWVRFPGGKLATWDRYDQYRDAVRHASIVAGGDSWVGLTDLNAEGKWKFVDGGNCGGDCDTLQAWKVGEPNDSGSGEDCAMVWNGNAKNSRGDTHAANDAPCGDVRTFVCEYDNFNYWDGRAWLNQPARSDVPSVPVNMPLESPQFPIEGYPYFKTVAMASLLLNVVLVPLVCVLAASQPRCCKRSRGCYSKVSQETDTEW